VNKIIVISYINTDVSVALEELVHRLPDHELVIPVTEDEVFVRSAVKVAQKLNRPYELFFSESSNLLNELSAGTENTTLCSSPLKEVLRYITSNDTLAIAWDDSVEAHMALHSVEDFGVEAWNIEGLLEPIQVASGEPEDLYEEMQEALSTFIEVFAAYVATEVIETIGKTVEQTLLEHIRGHINPFDEE
jgi:hypothetical protein